MGLLTNTRGYKFLFFTSCRERKIANEQSFAFCQTNILSKGSFYKLAFSPHSEKIQNFKSKLEQYKAFGTIFNEHRSSTISLNIFVRTGCTVYVRRNSSRRGRNWSRARQPVERVNRLC